MNIKDTILGIAIGDAYGVGIEFQDRTWIKNNIDFTKYVNMREGKQGLNYQSGFYSDDTEHSIGIIKALISKEPFTEELLLKFWKNEYDTDAKEKGFTRQGHGGIKDWYDGQRTIKEICDFQKDRFDPGNAPPMRAVPLGFVSSDKINEYAIINADSTHPNPKARAASILVARAAEYIIVQEGELKSVIKQCSKFIDDKDTKELLFKADKLDIPESLDESGYSILCGDEQPIPFMLKYGKTVYGLPCASMRTAVSALYMLKHSKDTFTGLKNSINLGGDIDSLAAICTGILGGRFGLESLPKFMLEQVEGRIKLEKLAEEFEKYLKK
ncbi:MAG: ADP-ribosylglycohydrolase family protein [Candidatus Woesearchaeota archaeon]